MNIESGLTIKNFSKQSGLSYEFSFYRDINRQSNFTFGVSGDDINLCHIKSGRIYDNENRFVYSVNYDSNTTIRTDISNGLAVTYVNDFIISNTEATGKFNYLIISGNGSGSVGIKINGELPDLSFVKLNDFSGASNMMSGSIINSTPERTYEITGASISLNADYVSVSGYTSGEIGATGYVWLEAETGVSYPSGTIGLLLNTNFGDISFSINSSPTDSVDFVEYLYLSPGDGYISTEQDKPFEITSYFNSGNSRNISVKMSGVSTAYYLPIRNYYNYSGSGYLTKIISGSGTLTGNISGVYTGTLETGVSGYSYPYVFTGLQTGTSSVLFSGISNSGISSGETFSGTYPYSYSGTLVSGNSGIVTGLVTGLITGIYEEFSGLQTGYFTFGASGTDSLGYSPYGYSGTYTNTISGKRSDIASGVGNPTISGLVFNLQLSGLDLPIDTGSYFYITDWSHQPILGGPINTGMIYDGVFDTYFEFGPEHLVSTGVSGTAIYTGILPTGQYYATSATLFDLTGPNVSGKYDVFIGNSDGFPDPASTGIWSVSSFSITNFPVSLSESYSVTGTGNLNHTVTGVVTELVSGVLTTGILESSGQPNFIDVWNLKTGTSSFIFDDFKYWNYYSGDQYWNSGSYLISQKSSINNYYLGVVHNGVGLSGFSVAKVIISDGSLSGEYLISGEGEYYS